MRTAAAKRVEKVLVPPVDPGNVAKRRELEAELLEPHPIVKAYESYVGKYAAEHGGIKREQAISRLFGARDATFLALRDAAATAPPSPIAAAARKVLTIPLTCQRMSTTAQRRSSSAGAPALARGRRSSDRSPRSGFRRRNSASRIDGPERGSL